MGPGLVTLKKMGQSSTESEIQAAIACCKSFSNIIGILAWNENLQNGTRSTRASLKVSIKKRM